MPVEANRIKGKLKEIFPKVNLSTKRLDEISARLAKKATDEADDEMIAQLVNDANDFMPFADIAKEDDKIRTLEANQKKPDSTDPTPPNDQPTPKSTVDAPPAWAKAMADTNAILLKKIEALETGKVIESKTQAARAEFEKNEIFKSIPEKGREFYFKQIDVNSETPFADQIKNLEETHIEITQSKADATGYAGRPPIASSGATVDQKLVDAIVGKK